MYSHTDNADSADDECLIQTEMEGIVLPCTVFVGLNSSLQNFFKRTHNSWTVDMHITSEYNNLTSVSVSMQAER